MTRRAAWQPWPDDSLEHSPDEVRASLRPLPPADEMIIEELTDEDRLFMAAVLGGLQPLSISAFLKLPWSRRLGTVDSALIDGG